MESERNNEVDNSAASKKEVMKQRRKIMRINQRQRTKEAKIAKNMAKVHEAAEDKRKKEMVKEKVQQQNKTIALLREKMNLSCNSTSSRKRRVLSIDATGV